MFGANSLTGKIKLNFPFGAARPHDVWHLSDVSMLGYSGIGEKKF